jgi:hypothetical protein
MAVVFRCRRLVFGVASLPLGTPVELEMIFEVAEGAAP